MSGTPTENVSNAPTAPAEPEIDPLARGGTSSIVALGATSLLLVLEAVGALGAGSSAAARALWWSLATVAVAGIGARAVLDRDERRVWVPTTVAFAAWFAGSLYYSDLDRIGSPAAFRLADVLLLSFGLVAALAAGRLAKSRVEGSQPPILPEGLSVAFTAS